MADSKISNLDSITSLSDDDLLVVVNDPSGTPTTNKITVANALGGKADLSGATFTGQVSLPQGAYNDYSLSIAGSSLDAGLYNPGAGLALTVDGSPVFIAYANELRAYQDLNPISNGAADLGTSSIRWGNVYSQDGNFSGSVTLGSDSADTITVNGVLTNGAQIYDGVGDVKVGYRNIPIVTTNTLNSSMVGKCLQATSTVSVPASGQSMASGDVVSIFNSTTSSISLSIPSGYTAYVGGTAINGASSVTLSAYGTATVLFIGSTAYTITGNVS